VIATLESRTAAKSLYAVVSVAYDSSSVHGTFKAVVQFKRPGRICITAFKDVPVLASGSVFDLLITPEVFALEIAPQEGQAGESDRGPISELGVRHPGFAGFADMREALFLPGKIGAVAVVRRGYHPDRIIVATSLASGREISWVVDPGTLDVVSGVIEVYKDVVVDYADFRRVGGVSVPGSLKYQQNFQFKFNMPIVTHQADDARAWETTMSMHLIDLEVNPDLDDSIFQPWPPGKPPR
jgi:hypothetical protein